jgi:hypothetical protein
MVNPQDLLAFAKRAYEQHSQPLKERASILPLGQYEDGSVGMAWPGLLAGPAEAWKRMYDTAASSPVMDDDQLGQISRDSFDAAGLAMTGGFATGVGGGLVDNAAGIFGGRLAKTADQGALKRAEDLAASGAPREQIFKDTGWFQGVDGKWRFEIDDSKSFYRGSKAAGSSYLPDVFLHDEFFSAYPQLDTVRVVEGPVGASTSGSYAHGPRRMELSGPNKSSTALHESQHGVQSLEGFAEGGNPDFGIPRNLAMVEARKAYEGRLARQDAPKNENDLLYEQLFGSEPKLTAPWEELPLRKQLEWLEAGQGRVYKNLAGEAEARAVQARQNLTADERRARAPWLDYDVPEADQIVRFESGGPQMSLPDNALGSAGGRLAKGAADLPMDLASRMARAKKMGFDTENVMYHGTRSGELPEFSPSQSGTLGPGTYLTNSASDAGDFARFASGDNGPAVMPLMARGPMADMAEYRALLDETLPYRDAQREAIRILQDAGYSGLRSGNEVSVFDPKNIRSTSAAFDPALSDSANLLAANAPTGAAIPAGMEASQGDENPALIDYLRAVGLM